MNQTCLSNYPPVPLVPKTANESNSSIHPAYNPNSGGISQMISASLASSTFSINDVRSLLNELFNKDLSSWGVSEITKTKPIPSIIIYSSIALALFLICSIIFCVVSCRSSKRNQRTNKRPSRITQVCVCLLVIIYLLAIGDMIYVAYRINNSKLSIDDTIKQVNRDVYPKDISEHLEYLNRQLFTLDQYCVQSNSILINASKSIIVKAFDGILKEKYYMGNITQSLDNIGEHIQELGVAIHNESVPSSAQLIFQDIQQQYQLMINYTHMPITEVCKYANETDTDIDIKLLEGLDIVNVQLQVAMDTINQDILGKITPWQDHMLMKTDFEEKIRGYISLAGTIFFVLVIVLGIIPLFFFVFVILSRLCGCNRNDDTFDRVPVAIEMERSDSSFINSYSNKVIPTNYRGSSKEVKSNNGALFCLMRIVFFVVIILLIVMVLVTGVYYTLDLVLHGACRTVHDDQPFLINLMNDKLVESNVTFGNSSRFNTTLTNVINDCANEVHFTRKVVENYWPVLHTDVTDMMNRLSEHIFVQFIKSIGDVNIDKDIDLLNQLLNVSNISDTSNIPAIVEKIDTDLATMQVFFGHINSSNYTLPESLVQPTSDQFKDYVKEVLESTIDGCPLPLALIYKTDTLVCHTLASSIAGLWLSVFFFMVLIIIGVYIFGICVLKRLN